MGRSKKWSGYTSWSYLEPNIDYIPYSLEPQVDRVEKVFNSRKYDFGLSKTQEERVEQIIEKNILIDLHEHLDVFPEGYPNKPSPARRRQFKGYEGLAYSGIDVVFENCVCSTYDNVVNWIGLSMTDYNHQDFVIPVRKFDDIMRAFKEGKVAVVPTIEQASAIDRDVEKVDLLYGLGVRSMGVVYSESNTLGSGLAEFGDSGLTAIGYDAIKRMNKTGVIIDVSHAGSKTAMDSIEASDKPILISHCGSRTLWNTTRMLPDDVLKACAEKGGVVGVEVAGFAPRTKKHPEASIECLLDHMKYLIEVLGIDHVGAGPDTLWGDHAGLYRRAPKGQIRRTLGIGHYSRERPSILTPAHDSAEEVKDLDYVKGLESPSDFTNIIKGLVRDGFSDNEIVKIMGLNALKLMKMVLV